MQNDYVVRRFSKTPLKHRMSKYLLEFLLDNPEIMNRIVFVDSREYLADTMMIAQASTEGPSFELELGAVNREEVSLENGRLVKQKKRIRAAWVHDPVQAVEVLRKFKGKLHVKFVFGHETPQWYLEAVTVPTFVSNDVSPDFAVLVREQLELALLAISLKNEIDQALRTHDRALFYEKVRLYNEICESCFWELT